MKKPRFRVAAASISWMPRFAWVGLYWQTSVALGRADRPVVVAIYLCILPCLPIVLRLEKPTATVGVDLALGKDQGATVVVTPAKALRPVGRSRR